VAQLQHTMSHLITAASVIFYTHFNQPIKIDTHSIICSEQIRDTVAEIRSNVHGPCSLRAMSGRFPKSLLSTEEFSRLTVT